MKKIINFLLINIACSLLVTTCGITYLDAAKRKATEEEEEEKRDKKRLINDPAVAKPGVKSGKDEKEGKEEVTCAICLDAPEGKTITLEKCKHIFCEGCFVENYTANIGGSLRCGLAEGIEGAEGRRFPSISYEPTKQACPMCRTPYSDYENQLFTTLTFSSGDYIKEQAKHKIIDALADDIEGKGLTPAEKRELLESYDASYREYDAAFFEKVTSKMIAFAAFDHITKHNSFYKKTEEKASSSSTSSRKPNANVEVLIKKVAQTLKDSEENAQLAVLASCTEVDTDTSVIALSLGLTKDEYERLIKHFYSF